MRDVLHVGCGAATLAKMPLGFQDGSWREVRFDINPAVRADIIGTITDMHAVATDSVDALYSSHNIEHVYAHQVGQVLREFRRVVKPDGFVVVTCPDLESVCAHVAAGKLADPLYMSPSGPVTPLDILYGYGPSIATGETYMAHLTGFTRQTLREHARAAGFPSFGVRRREQRFDLWLLATKQPQPNDTLRDMMNRFCRS